MLPLPIFQYHRPETLAEAVRLLADLGPKARIIAGGTDVLPNMKQGLFDPEDVVSVARLSELKGIRLSGNTLVVGAGEKLADIAESILVRRAAPALAEAAGAVGGPHHRAMGTLGGNVCLDTRCRYYNQTYFWRKSLGFCLKKDGTVCHVVKGGAKCVAAASNDTAPALLALDASLRLLGPNGERAVSVHDFYTADGIQNTTLQPGEIVVSVSVPIVEGRRSGFDKLRRRGAIDFPLLSIAMRVDVRAGDTLSLAGADLVVSALGARPRKVRGAASVGAATPVAEVADKLASAAYAECKPLPNVDEDTEWRREMIPVIVRKLAGRLVRD